MGTSSRPLASRPRRRRGLRPSSWAVVALAVAVTGCGDSTGSQRIQWPLTALLSLDPNLPAGWWTLEIEGSELWLTTPTAHRFPIGEVEDDTGDRLELSPLPDCGSDSIGGSYTWETTDGKVQLSATEDDGCADRQELLTAGAWERTTTAPLMDEVPDAIPAPLLAAIPLPAPGAHLAVLDEGVWATAIGDPTVYRVDPATNAVAGTVSTGSYQDDYRWLAAGEQSLWVTLTNRNSVARIDPATGAELDITVGSFPTGALAAHGAVWISDHHGGTVSRIDPATNTVTDTITVSEPGPGGPQMLVPADGAVDVAVPRAGQIRRIDPDNLSVSTVYDGRTLGTISVNEAGIWILEGLDAAWVTRVGPEGRADLLVGVGEGRRPRNLVATDDAVWVLTVGAEGSSPVELLAADPETGEIRFRFDLGFEVAPEDSVNFDVVAGPDGDVWVTTDTGIARIDGSPAD